MNIHFSYDLLEDEHLLKILEKHSGRFALLSDEKVASLYAKPFLAFMSQHEFSCDLITYFLKIILVGKM